MAHLNIPMNAVQPSICRYFRSVLLVALAVCIPVGAQTTMPSSQPAKSIDWSTLSERERGDLAKLLDSKDWPIRVFGMMRLERYSPLCSFVG